MLRSSYINLRQHVSSSLLLTVMTAFIADDGSIIVLHVNLRQRYAQTGYRCVKG